MGPFGQIFLPFADTTAGKPGKQQVTIQPAVEGLTNSLLHVGKNSEKLGKPKWGCIKTNLAIFGGMNIHLPVIWGSLGYQGFDSYPNVKKNRRKSPEKILLKIVMSSSFRVKLIPCCWCHWAINLPCGAFNTNNC